MSDFDIKNGELLKYNGKEQNVVIPDSVTSIGKWAFSRCSNLTSITIPNSVTSIGDSAFIWCSNLTSISIPDSVTSIEEYAFDKCKNLTIVALKGSYAIEYAKKNGIKYIEQ